MEGAAHVIPLGSFHRHVHGGYTGRAERDFASALMENQHYADRTLRELVRLGYARAQARRTVSGVALSGDVFLGDAFLATPAPGRRVRLLPGVGFQRLGAADLAFSVGGTVGLDDLHFMVPLVLARPLEIPVPHNPTADTRRDIVEVRHRRLLETPRTDRAEFDRDTGRFLGPAHTALTYALDDAWSVNGAAAINYKTGGPPDVGSGEAVAPAVTTGYGKVAEVEVPAGAAEIAEHQVGDFREVAMPYRQGEVSFRLAISGPPFLATLSAVVAPPGVRVGAYGVAAGIATCVLLPGALPATPVVLASRTGGPSRGRAAVRNVRAGARLVDDTAALLRDSTRASPVVPAYGGPMSAADDSMVAGQPYARWDVLTANDAGALDNQTAHVRAMWTYA